MPPARPNPIGLSIVSLLRIEGCTLYLGNVDILDGTPLLDVKPYVPAFDRPEQVRAGWLEQLQGNVGEARSDDRFSNVGEDTSDGYPVPPFSRGDS